jgi:hypothetical protein
MGDDGVNQTRCWIATHGWMWMEGYFDHLPLPVRQRLRASPFNLCPACLVTKFLPKLRRKHPNYSRQQLFFTAVEVMEAQVRQDDHDKSAT